MSNYDWVFWLNLTNIALGVVVVIAMAVVAYGIVWELWARHRKTSSAVDREMKTMLHNEFSHSLAVPELGLTMADGGEHLQEADKPKEDKKNK
jgi:hypothetical protein